MSPQSVCWIRFMLGMCGAAVTGTWQVCGAVWGPGSRVGNFVCVSVIQWTGRWSCVCFLGSWPSRPPASSSSTSHGCHCSHCHMCTLLVLYERVQADQGVCARTEVSGTIRPLKLACTINSTQSTQIKQFDNINSIAHGASDVSQTR